MNNNRESLVSVVIPTFRSPSTLDRAIKSALSQTYPNLEVIVVDDNSPGTEGRSLTEMKMIQFASDPRVQYIKHLYNKNGSAARNTGAKVASGEYIAFLDDDDEYLPKKIASQVERLTELPGEYGLCYSGFYIKKGNNRPFKSFESREGDLYFEALSRKLHVAAGSNLLIKKICFDSINGFDENFIRNQDLELLTRLLKKYKIAYSSEFGLIVNVHSNHSYFNSIDITDQYLEKFKAEISELPPDKRKIFKNNEIENRFFDLLRSNHDYKKCFRMIFKNEISIFSAIGVILSHSYFFIKNRSF